ncbi:hypothetical protein [Streptomyces sp. NPDC101237]|uniref:hypothetical protein n=1 Tax=Streptomyces sp. NPDC101237 TaxID=3366139 RepID=UPI00381617DB
MTSMPVARIRADAPEQPADLVLRNAKIFTGALGHPAATALAVRDGSLTVVAGVREIESLLTVVGCRSVHAAGFFEDVAPPVPPVRPEGSPVAHFGGYRTDHGPGRAGLRQPEGVRDAAAESAEHLLWRPRTGRAGHASRQPDTLGPCHP